MRWRRRKAPPAAEPVGLFSWVCPHCDDRGQPSLSWVADQQGAAEHQRFCAFYAAAARKAVAS
jgi:phage terminase large subunit GpA-like protein